MPYIQIDTTHKVYFQTIAGETDLPYLVFLHEGLGCTAMWGKFPEHLCNATGCPALLYDRQGFGLSSPCHRPRTIHYLHHSALYELPAVLDRLLPDSSYLLIGHSDGGTIALMHAAERPPGLLGTITEAAHICVDQKTISGIKSAENAWKEGRLQGLRKFHGDKTETMFRAWSETWLSEWFRLWNIEYLLPSIESPLLVIQGKNDHYGSQDQAKMIAFKSSGAVQMEFVENCDHIPHLEAQSVVLTLMTEFIEKLIR